MDQQDRLLSFFRRAVDDPRMSKAHMTVYMVLFYLWSGQQCKGLLAVYSRQVMPMAKISTSGTYYTIIKQLDEYGYLEYRPSYYRKRASQVNLEVPAIPHSSRE